MKLFILVLLSLVVCSFQSYPLENNYTLGAASIVSTIEKSPGVYELADGYEYLQQCSNSTNCTKVICEQYSLSPTIALILVAPFEISSNYTTCLGYMDFSTPITTILGINWIDSIGFIPIPNLSFNCENSLDCLEFICSLFGHYSGNNLGIVGIIPNNRGLNCI